MTCRPARFLGLLAFALSPCPALADPEAGRILYRDLCETCHGETAETGASGDIRGLPETAIRMALRGAEEMPEFDFLTDAEITALVTFLAALAQDG